MRTPEESRVQSVVELLQPLRCAPGEPLTKGLSDDVIREFETNELLGEAAREAVALFGRVRREWPALIALDEAEQIRSIQEGLLKFYREDHANPFVALAARGPWLITLKGAVVYDCGGYGILGLGHNPPPVLEAVSRSQAMANIMTANIAHLRFVETLRREIGQRRAGGCPYHRFVALNSGSEAVAFAARIADTHAKDVTDPSGAKAGASIKKIALTGGFHGRTDRPARFSHSTASTYQAHLASFRGRDDLIAVPANDIAALANAYERVERDGAYVEALFMEPVMGEGNPGLAITPRYYAAARALSREHGSLLLVDSIQAGLRATGYLSVVDYPGFERLDPPDMEAYSKALSAGQYPLSVVALSGSAAKIFQRGTYGNTMTANPRGFDAAVAVLDQMSPELRSNISRQGSRFVAALENLANELEGPLVGVQGTGLLISCQLDPALSSAGAGSVEDTMRRNGIGVIHGGRNSLRFTPHFGVSEAEIELVVDHLHHCVTEQWRDPRRVRRVEERGPRFDPEPRVSIRELASEGAER